MHIELGILNVEGRKLQRFIRHSTFPFLCVLCVLCGFELWGDEPPVSRYSETAIGVTGKGTPIKASVYEDGDGLRTRKTRVLFVGDGSLAGRNAVGKAVGWFHHDDEAKHLREYFIVSTVPNPYPDGRREGDAPFPPQGTSYVNDGDPEAAYLWRWIGMHAPDLVVEVRAAKAFVISAEKSDFDALERLRKQSRCDATFPKHSLLAQLMKTPPADVGVVPALAVGVGENENFMQPLLAALEKVKFTGPSPARKELQQRLDRTPLEVAQQLRKAYGDEMMAFTPTYIPALTISGQHRLHELTDDKELRKRLDALVEPYLRRGKSPVVKSHVEMAGRLAFRHWGMPIPEEQYDRVVELVRQAADKGFDARGEVDLKFLSSSEMSDAVFMCGPILAEAGYLTRDAKYDRACYAHLLNMSEMLKRDDGLWRHSPLDEAAWGRGNGFAALGIAMCMSYFHVPANESSRKFHDQLLPFYQRHMNVLAEHQDYTGAWHQVIDREESYRELSGTCMITYAMVRGVRCGWLDREKFQPIIDRAWHAIRTRVAADGGLVDVCTGTGKQKNLRAYLDRPAILGRDARGGAMALLVATELAAWEAERSK